ncbi:MAG: site-specific DNA-methyltransferase [Bacteroidales bacterium]|nr:site-specific DNA-methyltransferase [Bacteroidales bacterium]
MSTNISKQHREELLDKIRQIRKFIAAAPQDTNTGNLLQYLDELTKDVKGKKYGLVFEQHREQIDEILDNNAPVLTEEKSLFIDNGGEMNFLIEGDNLAALQLLEKTHKGKIDVIYIDPPYNTGNEDFMYDDDFVDIEDSYRHSKWLSFMKNRLLVAKKLIADSGIIFISIDDNEQPQLKILCDEIFSENNYIDTLMVEMSNTGGMKVGAAKKGTITKNGEYILVYAKNKQDQSVSRTPLFDFVPGFDTHFNLYLNSDGSISKLCEVLFAQDVIKQELNKFHVKTNKNSISLNIINELFDKSEVIQKFLIDNLDSIVRPRNEIPNIPETIVLKYGKWVEYNSDKREEPYYLTKTVNDDVLQLVPMRYNYRFTDDFLEKFGRSVIRGDYWKGFWIDMGNIAKEGAIDFKNGKKPIRLLKQLVKWAVGAHPSSTILDFFAGSGTTGHAVLKLNAEDGGHRKFILCTNNENNICRDVTYQRLKTVIAGKRKDGSEYNEKYPASLKYYKIGFVPISDKFYYEYADDLLKHVRELVELENGVNFNGNNEVAIVLTDAEMERFVAHTTTPPKILYRGHNVLLTAEQTDFLKSHGIRVNVIPDYYYNELNK